MPLVGGAGLNSVMKGDFGEAWLGVVAAGHRLLHGRPTTLDLERADVEVVYRGELNGTQNPCVKVQVKTAQRLDRDDDGALLYDLDVQTYDALRARNQGVARALVVIELDDEKEWVAYPVDGTLLRGRGAWLSLEGHQETVNTTTVRVRIPAENSLDGDGLMKLLAGTGYRRSTPVAATDEWRDS